MFPINEEIRKARTISSDFYTDPRFFVASAEMIFARSWHLLGREADLASIHPHELLPSLLAEPVVTVKRAGAPVRCHSNVCTHRGKILVEEPFDGDLIRCRYHGRRFSLEGGCLSMPEFEGVEGFPSVEDDLREVPTGVWNGFVFAGLDPVASLESFVGPINERLSGFDFGSLRFTGTKDYEIAAQWALYCENYLEGFHIPYVHPDLNKEVDYSTYTTELFRYSSLQTGRTEKGQVRNRGPFSGGVEAFYFFVFPNLMLNFYPWGVSVNIVKPLSPDRSVVTYLTYVSDEAELGKGAGADLGSVELEDQAVVESVQKGIRSRFYDRGRYSPTRETGTHHFHRLISEFMAPR
jgi:choline monooxygenase